MRSYSDPREFLLRRKHPDVGVLRSGANTVPSELLTARLKQIEAYEAELKAMSDDEIAALTLVEQRNEVIEIQFGMHAKDHRRFFAYPRLRADLEYWARLSFWTLHEGVALICEMDPEQLDQNRVLGTPRGESPFASRYVELLRLAERAQTTFTLAYQTTPPKFMAWVRELKLPYPPELEEAVANFHGDRVDWPARCAELEGRVAELSAKLGQTDVLGPSSGGEELKTRERESVLKILLGLAMNGYG